MHAWLTRNYTRCTEKCESGSGKYDDLHVLSSWTNIRYSNKRLAIIDQFVQIVFLSGTINGDGV